MQSIKRIFKHSLPFSLTLALSTSVVSAYAEDQFETLYENTVAVSIMPVEYKAMSKPISASGPVRPISEQRLTFKVSGIIERVFVRQGQEVKKGQVLATLVLDEIDANVEKARAVLDDANRQFERISELKAQRLLADQISQQAKTALEIAKSDLKISQFNQKYSTIVAPEDGYILTRSIEPNELIQPGQSAFLFAERKQGWGVKLAVADIDVVKLQLNDHADIYLDAYPNRVFKGQVREISGRADNMSQTFEVDISLMFEEGELPPKLYSGLIAHTDIQPSLTQHVAPIPFSSVISADGAKGTVYVVNENEQPVLKGIEIAYLSGEAIMVSAGLADGDQVITQGGQFIVKGSKLNIITNDSNPSSQFTQTTFK